MDVVGTERLLGRLKITLSESQNYLLSYLVLIHVFHHVQDILVLVLLRFKVKNEVKIQVKFCKNQVKMPKKQVKVVLQKSKSTQK